MTGETNTGGKTEDDLLRLPVLVEYAKCKIIYMCDDGTKTEDKDLACAIDRKIRRERHYNYLLEQRNWLEKLLNIKPSMKFYDVHELLATLNRLKY